MDASLQTSWTDAETTALCCEVTLLVDQVRAGAVLLHSKSDFYSTVAANLLARHSVPRSAAAVQAKFKKIRDEAIEASMAVDERPVVKFIVALNAPVYPGEEEMRARAPLLEGFSPREQAVVLKYKAEWGLDMAEAGSLQSMAAAARAALEEGGEQQQQQQQQQPQGSFTLPHHGK